MTLQMKFAASVAAIVTLTAAGAQAATFYSAPGVDATQADNTDYSVDFSAPAGLADLSFVLDGYASLDGHNWYEDDFTLSLNDVAILSGTFNLGGGGSDVVFFQPEGSTIENVSGNGTAVTWTGGHVNIATPLGLKAGLNTLTFAYHSLVAGHAGWQHWTDEHWGVSNIAVRAANGAGLNLPGGSAIPEPAAWGLMLIGFGGLGMMLRRQRHLFPSRA
jgi:hypothetical protein